MHSRVADVDDGVGVVGVVAGDVVHHLRLLAEDVEHQHRLRMRLTLLLGWFEDTILDFSVRYPSVAG